MKNREATSLFQKTEKLFREKRYEEALGILDSLQAEFPDRKNIIYPRALCLAKLNRLGEARALCEELIVGFEDERAQRLMGRIDEAMHEAAHLADSEEAATLLGPTQAFDSFNLVEEGDPADLLAIGATFNGTEPSSQTADPLGLGTTFGKRYQAMKEAQAEAEPAHRGRNPWVLGGLVAAVLLAVLIPIIFLLAKGGKPAPSSGAAPSAATPIGGAAAAQPVPKEVQWYWRYADGMDVSREYETPVLIFFQTPASEACLQMEQEVFARGDVIEALGPFVCIRADFDQEAEAAGRFGIREVPGIVILDAEGGRRHAATGYLTPASLLTYLEDIAPVPEGAEEFRPPTYALVLFPFLGLFFSIWPLYLTLLLTNKLPNKGFLSDILTVGLVGIGVSILSSSIPCVGFVVAVVILHNLYDMGVLDFVIYVGIRALFVALFVAIVFGVLGTALLDHLAQIAG